MTKFFLLPIALAAIAAPAAAEPVAPVPFSFTADGQTFNVVRVDTPTGAVLTGTDSRDHSFRLEVVGRRVSGVYGDSPISFTIPAPIAPSQVAMK